MLSMLLSLIVPDRGGLTGGVVVLLLVEVDGVGGGGLGLGLF